MLEYLTKRDLRTALKMVDGSHRNSLQYGISVLKKLDYNRQVEQCSQGGCCFDYAVLAGALCVTIQALCCR